MALIERVQSLQTGRREMLMSGSLQMRQSEGKTVLKTLAKAEETALRSEKPGGGA
jgi:hypothetical protein